MALQLWLVSNYLNCLLRGSRFSPNLCLCFVGLIVSAGITNIVISEGLKDSDSEEYIARYSQLAIQCAFLSGLINVGMGLLRLGFITQFLSKALISGFTSGAAVLISFSQLKHLFGYNIPASNTIQDTIKYLVQDIEQFNWKTFVIGLVCMGILLLLKRMSSNESMLERCSSAKWLGALSPILVTIVMISFSYGLDMNSHGIPIVGYIPPGLPSVTISWWTPLCPDLVVRSNVVTVRMFLLFSSCLLLALNIHRW